MAKSAHIDTFTADLERQVQKYSGSLPGCHLMLQPMLGFWLGGTGWLASTASSGWAI